MKLDKDCEDEPTWQRGGPNYMACLKGRWRFLKACVLRESCYRYPTGSCRGMFHADTAMREENRGEANIDFESREFSAEAASRRL